MVGFTIDREPITVDADGMYCSLTVRQGADIDALVHVTSSSGVRVTYDDAMAELVEKLYGKTACSILKLAFDGYEEVTTLASKLAKYFDENRLTQTTSFYASGNPHEIKPAYWEPSLHLMLATLLHYCKSRPVVYGDQVVLNGHPWRVWFVPVDEIRWDIRHIGCLMLSPVNYDPTNNLRPELAIKYPINQLEETHPDTVARILAKELGKYA